jgi:hypothetical protein
MDSWQHFQHSQRKVNQQSFNTWFKRPTIKPGRALYVRVPMRFQDWLNEHVRDVGAAKSRDWRN